MLHTAIRRIHSGVGMKLTLAISFGLIMAYLAESIGLAPIIGAFAAGLILDPVHFRYFRDPHIVDDIRDAVKHEPQELRNRINNRLQPHAHRHIEDLIEPLAHFFVPIFFVVTGMAVNLSTLGDTEVLVAALVLTVIAVVGKAVAGIFVPGPRKLLVGIGMVPRGEVGLIFAAIGLGIGVVTENLFSIIVIMVILTTLMTPPILAILLKKQGDDPIDA